MSYHLFLDDERFPKNVTWEDLPPVQWIIVRSFDDFVRVVKARGIPQTISFDHDLADEHYKKLVNSGSIDYNGVEEKTGYHCVKWFCEYLLDVKAKKEDFPKTFFHTMNPIGKQNMMAYWQMFRRNYGVEKNIVQIVAGIDKHLG